MDYDYDDRIKLGCFTENSENDEITALFSSKTMKNTEYCHIATDCHGMPWHKNPEKELPPLPHTYSKRVCGNGSDSGNGKSGIMTMDIMHSIVFYFKNDNYL